MICKHCGEASIVDYGALLECRSCWKTYYENEGTNV